MSFDPTSGMSTASVSTLDREKFLAAKLLERSYLKLVSASVCEKVKQPKGTGTTAYFVRYKRMNVPLTTLTEGTPPSNSTYSLEEVTVQLDQYGDVITITDVAKLTTSHPLWQQAMELLLDNAQRLIDREVQNVWLAGTNVMYGDGSVTSRSDVTSSMKLSQDILQQVRVNMVNAGVPNRDGPTNMKQNAKGGPATGNLQGGGHYVIVCGPEVLADIMSVAAPTGLWASVAQYQNAKAIYNSEMGSFLGFRMVETNFIPKFELLGNTTTAAAEGSDAGGVTGLTLAVTTGGSLASSDTFYWKVVRKDLTRGFAEHITIEHTTDTGASDTRFTFTFPSGNYAYDLYFGNATGDSNLKLVQANIAASEVVNVDSVPSSTTTAPASTPVDGSDGVTVHPVYVMGKAFCSWVGLQELQTFVTGDKAEKSDPLNQVQTMGYKFMGKTVITDQTRLLRLEVASAFSA